MKTFLRFASALGLLGAGISLRPALAGDEASMWLLAVTGIGAIACALFSRGEPR